MTISGICSLFAKYTPHTTPTSPKQWYRQIYDLLTNPVLSERVTWGSLDSCPTPNQKKEMYLLVSWAEVITIAFTLTGHTAAVTNTCPAGQKISPYQMHIGRLQTSQPSTQSFSPLRTGRPRLGHHIYVHKIQHWENHMLMFTKFCTGRIFCVPPPYAT